MGSSGNKDHKSSTASPATDSLPAKNNDLSDPMGSHLLLKQGLALRTVSMQKTERYRELGKELRQMFDDVVYEPIPTDLMELLQKLDKQSGGGSEKDS
jgi:hypothetical protein